MVQMVVVEGHSGERERKERKISETWENGWFLTDFGPVFLPPQGLKSTSIYRQWKWAILSTLEKKIAALDSVGKDPNH